MTAPASTLAQNPGLAPTYVESLRRALHALLADDGRAVVLGEDILDPYGGAFKVTQGLSTAFPTRVLTTPISEAALVGMAVGLALRGWHPVAEIMFGDFITLAADQLVNHAAKYGPMYNGRVSVPLVVRTPMGGGRGYGPTHSQSLERLFFGVPGLTLLAPSHLHDPGALLYAAVALGSPVLLVEHKLLYPQRLLLESTPPLYRTEMGDAHGQPIAALANYPAGAAPDAVIAAYGGMSRLLVPLLTTFAAEEINLLALLPAGISPLDPVPIAAAVAACAGEPQLLIAEESPTAFGWGAEVAAAVYARVRGARIARVGAQPTVIPAARALEDAVLPTAEHLAAALLTLLYPA
jgi:pyruvate/2-oxoglutarate/acetoin dehydrogenase E1 component